MVLILPPQSYLTWKVALTFLHTTALSSTIYRLYHRFKTGRAWWDDYVAFIPMVLDVCYAVSIWFRFPHQPNSDGLALSQTLRVLDSYWLTNFPYILITWGTRVVLCLSLARIFPKKDLARTWSLVLTGVVTFLLFVLLLIATIACNFDQGDDRNNCFKGQRSYLKTMSIFVADVSADILLIVSPLVIFWRIKLPRNERRLIMMVFSGSVLTLMISLTFMAIAFTGLVSLGNQGPFIAAGLSHIETTVSIFVCNLAVLATCIYRRIRLPFGRTGERHDDSYSESPDLCTCTSSESMTALYLTEISEFSSVPPSHMTDSIPPPADDDSTSSEIVKKKPRSTKSGPASSGPSVSTT